MTKPKAMVDIIVKDRNELHNIISEQQKEIEEERKKADLVILTIANERDKIKKEQDEKINKFFMTNEDLSPYLKSKLSTELRAKLKRE